MEFIIEKGSITTPKGYKACGVNCGIKDKRDMALLVSDVPATVAAMYTTNKFPAAPVLVSREKTKSGHAQALVVNSGNANACTGDVGIRDAKETATLTSNILQIAEKDVLVASTGVIGHFMPMDKIRAGVQLCANSLSENGGSDAADAIMTTDTFKKHFSVEFEIGGKKCSIGAIAKGSGMINPNMATTINILTTDVAISAPLLDKALREAVSVSLNALTIDGSMSTNDSIFLFANGLAGNAKIKTNDDDFSIFASALKAICIELARTLAKDGEGATKLVTVTVDRAQSTSEAERAAKEIANAALVKTAIFGRDPNWGRIFAAVGGCDVSLDPHNTTVQFAGITVAEKGMAIEYDETAMTEALKKEEIPIYISLGAGNESATIFTCDLTYDYVKINAEYTT